jgi:hypothetical protein
MAATLEIKLDPADVRRGFGVLIGEAKKANQQIVAAAKGAANDRRRIEREEIAQARRDLGAMQRERIRAANERTRLEQKAAKDREKAERDVTKRAAAETKNRLREVRNEAREVERLAREMLRAREQNEKAATRAAAREGAQREREQEQRARAAARQQARYVRQMEGRLGRAGAFQRSLDSGTFRGVMGAAGRVGSAIGGAASDLQGQVQGARANRAQAEVPLGAVFRQAGFSVRESVEVRRQFEQTAERLGVSLETLASAAGQVQGEFSTFSATEGADATTATRERAANVARFLSQAELGRNVVGAESIGEFTRLGGLVRQIGGSDDQQRATMLGMSQLAELGSVELRDVVSSAMQPLMARVGTAQAALGPGATQGARVAAGHRALVESMAEMEVLRGTAGYNPRNAGNIMGMLGTAIQSGRSQDAIRNNILQARGMTSAQRAAVEGQLFENDPTQRGRRRLRANLASSPVAFIAAAGQAFQNNPTLLRNIFAGGGHGNPQALQANWRNLAASLFTTNERGETGYTRVGRFAGAAAQGMGAEELERRRKLAEADPMTKLQTETERNRNALLMNTTALEVSNRIAAFQSNNPMVASLLGQMPGGQGMMQAWVASRMGAERNNAAAGPQGPGMGERALGMYTSMTGGAIGALAPGLAVMLRDAIRDGMRNATVSVDSHTAAQLGAQGASGSAPPAQ